MLSVGVWVCRWGGDYEQQPLPSLRWLESRVTAVFVEGALESINLVLMSLKEKVSLSP